MERMVITPAEMVKQDIERKCEAEIQAVLRKWSCTFSVLQNYVDGQLVSQGVAIVLRQVMLPPIADPAGNGGGKV